MQYSRDLLQTEIQSSTVNAVALLSKFSLSFNLDGMQIKSPKSHWDARVEIWLAC